MKIKVSLEASEASTYHVFELEDLNVTEEEWAKLSNVQKNELIEKAVDDLTAQPYWVVSSFTD